MRRVEEGTSSSRPAATWQLLVYANTVEYAEHLVLVKGDVAAPAPVLVRMHAVDLLDDMLGRPHVRAARGDAHDRAEGRGVVV